MHTGGPEVSDPAAIIAHMFESVESFEGFAARLSAATATLAPAQLGRLPLFDLDPGGVLVDELISLAKVKAAAEARSMLVMAELVRRAEAWAAQPHRLGSDSVAPEEAAGDEIAAALRMSPTTAAIHVYRAATITTRLPATLAALGNGQLDLARVLAIEEATSVLDPATAARVETTVLGRAVDQTPAELRATLKRAVIAADPAAAEKRRKRAVLARAVRRYTDRDGVAVLEARLAEHDVLAIYDTVNRIAQATLAAGDARPIDAIRADVLVVLILGREPHPGPGDIPPRPAPDDGDSDQPPPPDPSDDDDSDHPPPPGPFDDDGDRDRMAARPADGYDAHDPAEGSAEPAPGPDDRHDLSSPAIEPSGRLHNESEDPAIEPPPDPLDDDIRPEHSFRPEDSFRPENSFRPEDSFRGGGAGTFLPACLAALATARPPPPPQIAINHLTNADGYDVALAETLGHGPITIEQARYLLQIGAARPPPTGRHETTSAQAAAHDPPAALAREIRARDGTCRFPACRRAAYACDLDHTVRHPEGPTLRGNLAALCRRHHRRKHTGGWTVHQHPDTDGLLVWTSPTGHIYTTYPRGTDGAWRGTSTGSPQPAKHERDGTELHIAAAAA